MVGLAFILSGFLVGYIITLVAVKILDRMPDSEYSRHVEKVDRLNDKVKELLDCGD